MTRIVIFFTFCLSMLSARGQQEDTLVHPDWIVGTWKMETGQGTIYESWTKKSDGHYTGEGYVFKNDQKVIRERLELVLRDGIYYYIPTVPDQNNGEAIPFACTFMQSDEMTFENPEHDYPQIIRYQRQSANALLAEISGIINGELRTEQFPLRLVE